MGTVRQRSRLRRAARKGRNKNKPSIPHVGFGDQIKSADGNNLRMINGSRNAQTEKKVTGGKQETIQCDPSILKDDIHPAPGCSTLRKNSYAPTCERNNIQLKFRAFFLRNSQMGYLQARKKCRKMMKMKKKCIVRAVSNCPDSGNYAPAHIKMQKRSMPSPSYSTSINQLQTPVRKFKPIFCQSLAKSTRIVSCEPEHQALNISTESHQDVDVPRYIFAFRDKGDIIFKCSPELKSDELKSVVLGMINNDNNIQTFKETRKKNLYSSGCSGGEILVSAPCEDKTTMEDQPSHDEVTYSPNDSVEFVKGETEVSPGKKEDKRKNVSEVDICTKLLVSKALLSFTSSLKTYADLCIRFLSWSSISIKGDIDSNESNEDDFVNVINHCHDKVIILLEFLALLDRRQIINVDDSEICNAWLLHDAIICILQAYQCCSDNASSSSKEHSVSVMITVAKMIVPNEGLNLKQWVEFMKIVRGIGQSKLLKEQNLCKCSNLFDHLLKNRQCRLCEVWEFYEGTSKERPEVQPVHPNFAAEPVEILFPRLSSFLRTFEEWSEEEYRRAFTKHSYQRFLCNSQSCLYPCKEHIFQVFCNCFSPKEVSSHEDRLQVTKSHPENEKMDMCPAAAAPQVSAKSLAVEEGSTTLQAADEGTSSEDFRLQLDRDSESESECQIICDTTSEEGGSLCVPNSHPNLEQSKDTIDSVNSSMATPSPLNSASSGSASVKESSDTPSTCLDQVTIGSGSNTSIITEVVSNVSPGKDSALKLSELPSSLIGNKGSISDEIPSSSALEDGSTVNMPLRSYSGGLSSLESTSVTTISLCASSSGVQPEVAEVNHGSQPESCCVSSTELRVSKRKHEDSDDFANNGLTEDLSRTKPMKSVKLHFARPFKSKLSLSKNSVQNGHTQHNGRNFEQKHDDKFCCALSRDFQNQEAIADRNIRFQKYVNATSRSNFQSLKQTQVSNAQRDIEGHMREEQGQKGTCPSNHKSILQGHESKKSKVSSSSKSVRFQDQMHNCIGKVCDYGDKETSILEEIAEQMLEVEKNFQDELWMTLKGKARNENLPIVMPQKGKEKEIMKKNPHMKKPSRVIDVDMAWKKEIRELQKKYLK